MNLNEFTGALKLELLSVKKDLIQTAKNQQKRIKEFNFSEDLVAKAGAGASANFEKEIKERAAYLAMFLDLDNVSFNNSNPVYDLTVTDGVRTFNIVLQIIGSELYSSSPEVLTEEQKANYYNY